MTTVRTMIGLGVAALALVTAPAMAADTMAAPSQTAAKAYPSCSKSVSDECTNAVSHQRHLGGRHAIHRSHHGRHFAMRHHKPHRHAA